jgi:hypothetical protein
MRKFLSGGLSGSTTRFRGIHQPEGVLASKLSGPGAMTDELSAAAKGAQRETRGLIAAIDDTLDAASKREWSPRCGAIKVPGTEEVRWLPETQQERDEALFKR